MDSDDDSNKASSPDNNSYKDYVSCRFCCHKWLPFSEGPINEICGECRDKYYLLVTYLNQNNVSHHENYPVDETYLEDDFDFDDLLVQNKWKDFAKNNHRVTSVKLINKSPVNSKISAKTSFFNIWS